MRFVFVNSAFHCSPEMISRAVRSGDRGGHMSIEAVMSPNKSRSSVMETRSMCAVAEVAVANFTHIYTSSESLKNPFSITARFGGVVKYGADYPIS